MYGSGPDMDVQNRKFGPDTDGVSRHLAFRPIIRGPPPLRKLRVGDLIAFGSEVDDYMKVHAFSFAFALSAVASAHLFD